MKRALLSMAVALVTGLLSFAPAEAAQVNFIGQFTIVAQAGVCDFNRVGERYSARFRPANLGDNNEDTNLTLFSDGFSLGFRKNNGSFNNTFQVVDWVSIGGGFGFDENITVTLKILTQAPQTLTASTPFLYMTGQIQNYDFDPGCVVLFTSGFTRRVEN